MFLVKCKCKSIFTLQADKLAVQQLYCPNCKSKIDLDPYTSLAEQQELKKQVESVTFIPDNAKITVTFDA